MADLDTLRPEVAEAIAWLKSGVRPGTRSFDGWSVIRAELLRLADQARTNIDMAACMDLLRRDCIAAAAIPESVPPMFYSEAVIALHRRAEAAEAELAALKARIANSCRADGQRVFDLLCLPVEFDGTLALVKLEDGEA